MADFRADTRDIQFVLFEQCRLERLYGVPHYKELDRDTADAILEQAFTFAKEQLGPINAIGDREGVKYDAATKSVKMPAAFKSVYKLYCENGWLGLAHNPEWGGQGMPYSLSLAANDYFFGGCLSFCLNVLLTTGAAHLIETFGTDKLKKLFLEKMYSGQWAGTMCLTEAGAGSDVGASRTRAKKVGEHYLIEGEKVFISSGEHDLTENICHPVLARIEGAPEGTKGLSLFLVPKVWVNDDGSLGGPNDVVCSGTEHKMGIHASPTCTLIFGGEGKCRGYLLGQENKGMSAMFQMMNEARISVGLQGAALANAAYQQALAYARERVQGKDLRSGKETVILNHPDVRQMLMWQKTISEGCRALLLRTAMFYDLAHAAEKPEDRERYLAFLELLTPICKAYASDQGFRSAELSLQTLGGYGYLCEYGVEQLLRDTKIASIYEGTNGIQALDLIGRKLPAKGGEGFKLLVGRMSQLVADNAKNPILAGEMKILGEAIQALVDTAMYFATTGMQKPAHVFVNATPFLDLFGNVAVGWLLLEQATIALPKLLAHCQAKGVDPTDLKAMAALCETDQEATFLAGKLRGGQFFARRSLAMCPAKAAVLKSGDLTPVETPL